MHGQLFSLYMYMVHVVARKGVTKLMCGNDKDNMHDVFSN